MTEREYDRAIQLLAPLQTREDSPPEILLALAKAYLRIQDGRSALSVVDDAISRYPVYIPAREFRAALYERNNQNLKALEDLEHVLKAEPRNAPTLDRIGLLLVDGIEVWTLEGDEGAQVRRIVEVYERLLELRTGREQIVPLRMLALVYRRCGAYDKAIESAKEAVRLGERFVRSQLLLAEAYAAAGRKDEALATYRQAFLIEPENRMVRTRIGELIEDLGLEGGLLAFYGQVAQSFPKVKEIQDLYGEELIQAAKWPEAAEHFQVMLGLWPDDRRSRAALVISTVLTGKGAEARAQIQKLVDDQTTTVDELVGLAELLSNAGERGLAIDLLKEAAATHSDPVRILLTLAALQEAADDQAGAILTLEKLVEKRASVRVVARLGELYGDAGRFEDAHALYERAKEWVSSGQEPEIEILQAQLFEREERDDEAIEVLERLLAREGDESPSAEIRFEASYMEADLYAERNAFDQAHAVVDRFNETAQGPLLASGRRIKAWVHWRAREYGEAIPILEELSEKNPSDLNVIQLLAFNYLATEDFEKAERLIDSAAAEMDQNHPEPLLRLKARILQAQKKFDEAIGIMERLMADHESDAQYHMELGTWYNEAGRIEDAERMLRRAIALEPNEAEGYNALGYFFAEAGVKLDEAVDLIEKALELNPDKHHILDSLGWAYYQQALYDQAVGVLEDAVMKMHDSGEPSDAVILGHLGDAYDKAGRATDAVRIWKEALEAAPESEALEGKIKGR